MDPTADDVIVPVTKVLVIDDSNTIRRSAEIFLRQGGHEVVLAEDGFDALAKVNDHDPQLIFCDILMPRLDGYQTCAIIKRNPRFAHVLTLPLSVGRTAWLQSFLHCSDPTRHRERIAHLDVPHLRLDLRRGYG